MPQALVILLRSLLMFLITFVLARILGKRQPSRMTSFGFVAYVVLAVMTVLISLNIVTNLLFGLIALAVWVLLPVALDYLAIKSKWLHDVYYGRETILVKQGKVMEENLIQARWTAEELLRELRSKNVFSVSDVEFAVLEATGDVSVLPRSDKKPVSAHDLGQKIAPQSEPQTVILDGNILDEPLASMGLNRQWLNTQLEKQGLSLDNVYIGQVNSVGEIYFDLFDDAIQVPAPKVRETVYASLEQVQANLAAYALETQDEGAKFMYAGNAAKLADILRRLEPFLLR